MMTHELNAHFTNALVCPACRGPLLLKDNFLWSGDCGQRFPVVEGIPIFGQLGEFYEGKYTEVNCTDRSFESPALDIVHQLLLRIEKSGQRWICKSTPQVLRRLPAGSRQKNL